MEKRNLCSCSQGAYIKLSPITAGDIGALESSRASPLKSKTHARTSGLLSLHIPTLPHHSHVQSHPAIFENNLCDSIAERSGDRDCRRLDSTSGRRYLSNHPDLPQSQRDALDSAQAISRAQISAANRPHRSSRLCADSGSCNVPHMRMKKDYLGRRCGSKEKPRTGTESEARGAR